MFSKIFTDSPKKKNNRHINKSLFSRIVLSFDEEKNITSSDHSQT